MSTLLIVDDNEQNLYMLQVLLSANGFQVERASNGAEALERARRAPPDMIISDILMPVMDGFTLCRSWKEDERLKNIPFVFYTATYTDPKDEDLALSLGADRFIIKPVEPDKFLALLLETMKNYEADKGVAARQPVEGAEYYKEYNAVLIRKLEDKMLQLEEANRILEGDIAERKRGEEALKQAEEKYRSIFENAVEGIFQATPGGRFLSVNPAFAGMCGFEVPEEMMTAITDIETQLYVNPEDRTQIRALYEGVGVVKDFETQLRRTDGRVIWVSINARAVRDEDGNILYYEGTIEDVTERKRVEEERTCVEAQLRQAQKMEALGTLAGGIAHDFNNILGIIVGYSEMAQLHADDESRVREKLREVLKAAGRAKDLVGQILAFSRLSEQEKRPVQVGPIVKEVFKMLRASLPSTIEIQMNVASTAVVSADPTQIHQVLMNLSTNAAHAMRDEGGVLGVSLTDVRLGPESSTLHPDLQPGPYVELTIEDTGHGMEPSILDRIFDPFFTTKEQGVGTGLGLSVVHGIVKSHGGAMEVESLPGKGTTFQVFLPAMETAPGPRAVEAARLPRGRERILVVDDEPALAMATKQMLEYFGYEVECRTNGIEALKAFSHQSAEKPFDLVITDMTMHHMTGVQLAQELLRLQPTLSILLCTGFSEKVDAEKARSLGIQGFLMKPVVLKELAAVVRKVLDERRE